MQCNKRYLLGILTLFTAMGFGVFNLPSEAMGQEMRTVFSYHDGIPYQANPTDGWMYAVGTFFFPTDSGRYYQATKFRFYNGYDYPPPQVGYEYRLYLIYRDLDYGEYINVHVYPELHLPPLTTTCNYCWEEVDIPYWAMPILIGGDTFDECLGFFMRPESDEFGLDYPYLWLDATPDYPMTTALINFDDNDTIGDVIYSEIGELLIDIEITYLDETPVDESSFSKLKQLWSPPFRFED